MASRTLALAALLTALAVGARARAQGAPDDFDLDAVLAEEDGEGDPPAGAAGDEEIEPIEPAGLELPVLGATTFSMTSTTIAQYRGDNFNRETTDDDFFSISERLELAAQGEETRVAVRIDGFLPLFLPDCPEGSTCLIEPDLRPERMAITWQRSGWTIDAGDSYAVLGRGIALSLRKVDLLGVDDALRGLQVQHTGDHFYVRALGGVVNPQNLDPTSLWVIDEPTDAVAGGEFGVRLGPAEELELGVHGVRYWFDEDPDIRRTATIDVIGWHAATPALMDGKLVLYGEVDAMRRQSESDLIGDERRWGRAVYGSAQLQVDRTSLLVEWKDYRDFIVAETNTEGDAWRIYSAAPALERDEERLRATYNARGARAQVDYDFGAGEWSAALNGVVYGHAEEHTQDPWDGILVTHGFVQVQRSVGDAAAGIGWNLDVIAGYRRETYLHDPPGSELGRGDVDWDVLHGTIDASVALGEHAFELRIEHREEKRMLFEYVEFVRGGVTLNYAYGNSLVLSPTIRWNTEKKDRDKVFYPGLEARWQFREGSFVRVFGGQTPGGFICSGGVCRDVPAFEGVLGEVVVRL